MFQVIFLEVGSGLDLNMFMLPLALVVLYFFMIRPQMKRQKKEKTFQAEIGKGKNVITSSGIHGRIVEVNGSDNTVTIETGAGKIKFERSAISMELSKRYLPKEKK
jgi:preprotein translocase subunit YajC